MRRMMQAIRSGVRRSLGLGEDRASLWSGLQAIETELRDLRFDLGSLRGDLDAARVLAGRALAEQMAAKGALPGLQAAEFKVFSQFGDDGIIQYLIRYLKIEPQTFVEFGVGDYRESNTRFLLMNNNWRGLIIDGNKASMDKIKQDPVCVFYGLTAVCDFITRENINDILTRHGFAGPLGILSVDIDGNDYWVWQAIEAVDPMVVVCEYNSTFGSRAAVTVPYRRDFQRYEAHPSRLYYGASVAALCSLASRKGYACVGSNSSGNNVYFVKRDRLAGLKEVTAAEAWRPSRFHEAIGFAERPPREEIRERLKMMGDCPLVDVVGGGTLCVKDLLEGVE